MPKGPSKMQRAAEREAKKAPTTREVYLADYRGGLTVSDIARKYAVSRQTVSQAINGRERFLARQRSRDAVRKAPTIRKGKICSACGNRGHQYNSPKYHPENSKAA